MMNHRTMKLSRGVGILLLPLAVLTAQDDAVKSAVRRVQSVFAPDTRVSVFDISWEQRNDAIVLKGEIDNPEAKKELIAAVGAAVSLTVLDSIRVLPDPSLGDNTYGIVTLSVGNIRSKPGEPEELSTQVLMGSVVKLLKKGFGYWYVQTPDQYLGWMDDDAFLTTNRAGADAWAVARKVVMTGNYGIVREQATSDGQPVCDVVIGGIFKSSGVQGSWTPVELADGRKGFIESPLVRDYDEWKQRVRPTPEGVERTARMFVGVPYLWGGTSAKGMDCSGFTKTVFRANGLELQRDANQQSLQGAEVPLTEDFRDVRKGDLLFFGRKATAEKAERITHVGIYLENKQYIHSSGRVRFNSFDPSSPLYNAYNLKRLVRVRRVIPSETIPEVHH